MKIKQIVWQERPHVLYSKSKIWVGLVGDKVLFGATNSMQDGTGQWGLQCFFGLKTVDRSEIWFSALFEMQEAAQKILGDLVEGLIE